MTYFDPIDDLVDAVRSRQSVLVVGTGVTSAATGRSEASWPGFLSSGLRRLQSHGAIDSETESRITGLIERATTQDLLTAASELTDLMDHSDQGEFGRWLYHDIGRLSDHVTPAGTDLVNALGDLNLPIFTTNYDDVLRRTLGRDYSTWQEPQQVQRVLSRSSRDVVHLHGHWKHPSSIVLTSSQYDGMLADEQNEILRQAMASINSMIFVGFGEGLEDPHFVRLRDWIFKFMPDQELQHFRLCRTQDLEPLRTLHRGEPIKPVAYGDRYEDLPAFLAHMKPSPIYSSNDSISEIAFEAIEDSVRTTAVLAAHTRDIDSAQIQDLLVPPVLLPVPTQGPVPGEHSTDRISRVQRCDLAKEFENTHIILAGDEHVGVTSALQWFGYVSSKQDEGLVPLYVDFLTLGSGPRPLDRTVRRALRRMGASLRNDDPLPPIFLLLDNANTANGTLLERVARELELPHFKRVFIGCRIGAEAIISGSLGSDGSEFVVRYIGSLARADVRHLAELVNPSRARELSKRASDLVESYGLPSTPFTLSMLLSAMFSGLSLNTATSPTSLLDGYVELLLGRGTLEDDSRLGLDAVNKSHLLSKLAESLVRGRNGALPEAEVVGLLANFLDAYSWSGSASDVLTDLRNRRILTVSKSEVAFTQNSYLYLFAAKRAVKSPEFRRYLESDPLYFAPIIGHYAALTRDDFDMVQRLVPELLAPLLEQSYERSQLFRTDRMERGERPTAEDVSRYIERQVDQTPDKEYEEDELRPLDSMRASVLTPFPLLPVDEKLTPGRAMVILGLSSNLMRDTEVVEDQGARRDHFKTLLRAWSRFVDLMELDIRHNVATQEMADRLAEQLSISPEKFDRFLDDLLNFLPLALGFGGVTATLSSAKLSRLIDACLDDSDFRADPALVLLANHILYDVHAADWTRVLPIIEEKHSSVAATTTVVRRLAFFAYLRRSQTIDDEQRLQDFLVSQTLLSVSRSSERSVQRGRAIESLKRAKLVASQTRRRD